jgi:signal transduction histidine kinase
LDDEITLFLGTAMFAAAVVSGEKEADFAALRSFFRAHYPLIITMPITKLAELINTTFYEKYENYFGFLVIAAFVWIFARQVTSKKKEEAFTIISSQKAELDRLVEERTAELTRQKNELQQTLELLQTTQQQLIQSEKLASLGELTAGIAHEIQNPLNFVNNFSEVSVELVDEMIGELANGETQEAEEIAADIKMNLEKILHHGKRADSIVKGMLHHSRASNGVKEPADINKLADEYFRLAYHGLRAKDKSFNAELITSFAPDLPMLNIIPQDIGRVFLNLFTNAFYAVHQKQKQLAEHSPATVSGYKPTVEVHTAPVKDLKGHKAVQITVKDNGTGIPDAIKDKIMQPFFTTKPTGEGTGLGLSLTYDMVVKGHGGKIEINSTEGEGSEFIITLPV